MCVTTDTRVPAPRKLAFFFYFDLLPVSCSRGQKQTIRTSQAPCPCPLPFGCFMLLGWRARDRGGGGPEIDRNPRATWNLSVGSVVHFIGCRRLSFFFGRRRNNPPPVTYRNPTLCNHGKSSSSSWMLCIRSCCVSALFGANDGRRRHILCCFYFLAGITNENKCQCEDWWSVAGGDREEVGVAFLPRPYPPSRSTLLPSTLWIMHSCPSLSSCSIF